jgi:hypothetical protein
MDGRTFRQACYDFANTTLSRSVRRIYIYMFPAAMQGLAHKRVGELGLVGLARTQTCVTLQMYVFSPPHSQMTATQFLFLPSRPRLSLVCPLSFSVCGFARQPAPQSCIYYSLASAHQMQSRRGWFRLLVFHAAHSLFFSVHGVVNNERRIKLFHEMCCNSTGKS